MTNNVLVFAEQRSGRLHPASVQTLNCAAQLAQATGGQVAACLVGSGMASLADTLAQHGAAKVFVVEDASLERYQPQPYTAAVSQVVNSYDPQIVLMPATFMGKDLAPRVATRTQSAMASDCAEVWQDNGATHLHRSMYCGKIFGEFQMPAGQRSLLTIRPNAYTALETAAGASADVEKIDLVTEDGDARLVNHEVARTGGGIKDVTEADIIVTGGRPLKSEENFKIIYELAEALDAAVGASRAAVDAGYQPHARQVGLTGKTVTPVLYIACGIDGAIQHLAGMRGSKVIVAVNTKEDAPIFQVATYGCVASLFDVVPLLTKEVKLLKGEA